MMIKAGDLIALFRQALSERWGYIWGTAGVKWTKARQDQLNQTTDADRAMGRKYGSKWIGSMVADCSGLFTWAFKKLGGTMYHGSNTMYLKWCDQKGELKKGKRTDGATLKPGTAVFVWNGKTYSHVGLYVGDGVVIEAAGTQQGVITSKVTATKWTHWGELKGITFDGVAPDPEPKPEPAAYPTLRRGDKGPNVISLQQILHALGYGLGPCGVDGDYGRATAAAVEKFQYDRRLTPIDGICGPITWAALEKAVSEMDKEPDPITYTVVIRGLSLDEANKLVMKYPDAAASAEGSVL